MSVDDRTTTVPPGSVSTTRSGICRPDRRERSPKPSESGICCPLWTGWSESLSQRYDPRSPRIRRFPGSATVMLSAGSISAGSTATRSSIRGADGLADLPVHPDYPCPDILRLPGPDPGDDPAVMPLDADELAARHAELLHRPSVYRRQSGSSSLPSEWSTRSCMVAPGDTAPSAAPPVAQRRVAGSERTHSDSSVKSRAPKPRAGSNCGPRTG